MDEPTAVAADANGASLVIPNGRLRLWLGIGFLFFVAGFFIFRLAGFGATSAEQAAKSARLAVAVAGAGGILIAAIATLMPRAHEFADAVRVKYLFRTRSIPWAEVASITTEEVDGVATDIDPSRGRLRNQAITAAIAGVAGASDEELRGIVTLRSGGTVKFWVSPRDARRVVAIWQRRAASPS